MVWIALFLFTLTMAGPAWAGAQRDELQIGIPDLPRRVQKTLPQLKPEQEIRMGIFKLHPSFESVVEYDDNVTLTKKDKKDDVIFTESPGFVTEVKLGDHRFETGYGMEIVSFATEHEENTTNHLAHALLELNFNDLTLNISDSLEKSTLRSFSETSARDKLFLNSVDIGARYDRPHWAGEFDWRHNTVDHLVDTLEASDYEEDAFAILGGYKILPKTLLLLEVDAGVVNYHRTGNANQDYWQLLGGFRGEPTERLSLTTKLGYQNRQLGDVPGQGTQTDFSGLVANMDFVFAHSGNDAWRLAYMRSVRTSTFGNNSWYRQDRISASYARRFLDKWTLTPQFAWQINDYPERTTVAGVNKLRQDSFWQAGVELRYQIQEWLSTAVAYRFRNRNSNFDSLDFDNNRFIADITVAY